MTRVVPPLTEDQARWIRPLGLLADDPSGLQRAWAEVESEWTATIERASQLPSGTLDRRVDGEWSFLETVRHLIFVTDAWIGRMVLELPDAHDPSGVSPDFVTNGAEFGLDPDARPSADEVLASRSERRALIDRTLAGLTSAELDRPCVPLDGQFTVLGAVQNVVFEEWAHHQYATRDLRALGSEPI